MSARDGRCLVTDSITAADRVTGRLDATEYQRLLELRTGRRHFLHCSETQARTVGLTPAPHQLLLAIRGHLDPRGPKIGDIADYLVLQHHMHVEELARLAPTMETLWRAPAASR